MCVQLQLLPHARFAEGLYSSCRDLRTDPFVTKHPPFFRCGGRVHGDRVTCFLCLEVFVCDVVDLNGRFWAMAVYAELILVGNNGFYEVIYV